VASDITQTNGTNDGVSPITCERDPISYTKLLSWSDNFRHPLPSTTIRWTNHGQLKTYLYAYNYIWDHYPHNDSFWLGLAYDPVKWDPVTRRIVFNSFELLNVHGNGEYSADSIYALFNMTEADHIHAVLGQDYRIFLREIDFES
jgi:hypothetical protein